MARDARGRFVNKPVSEGRLNILFILDESGSMADCKADALKGFNRFLTEQQGVYPSPYLTLTTFNTEVRRRYVAEPINQQHGLATWSYQPVGGTALYDAVGETISEFDPQGTRVLCVILTDGEENSSRTWDKFKLKHKIEELQRNGNWTFVFMGADQDAWTNAQKIGIHRGNTMSYESANTYDAFAGLAVGTQNYVKSGVRSSVTFFEPNLRNLTTTQVQNKLVNARPHVRILPVEKEMPIQQFVEEKLGYYKPGNAFYQLTKNELVQSNKDIMLIERGKTAVWSGSEGREVLGLPTHEVKVHPGDHAKWDIFVQSYSNNRKLVRGTKLIVRV
jgi:hypothetical protein